MRSSGDRHEEEKEEEEKVGIAVDLVTATLGSARDSREVKRRKPARLVAGHCAKGDGTAVGRN